MRRKAITAELTRLRFLINRRGLYIMNTHIFLNHLSATAGKLRYATMLLCATVLLLCTAAGTADANISVFPYSIDFDAASSKRVQSVRIINTSSETQTYRVSFVNFIQDENGALKETTDKNGFYADKYLSWSPRQFTLKPNEVQTINIARKSLAQAPDGEFVSHLKISEVMLGAPKPKAKPGAKSNTLSMQLKALFAITLPVTITKGDNLYSKTELSSYKLLPDGKLELIFKRLGNKSSRFNIAVADGKDKDIGRMNGVKIYMSTDTLNVNLPLDKNANIHNAILKLEDAKTKEEIFRQALQL